MTNFIKKELNKLTKEGRISIYIHFYIIIITGSYVNIKSKGNIYILLLSGLILLMASLYFLNKIIKKYAKK